MEHGCFRHDPWRVTFHHPARIVDDVFSLHTLHLESNIDVKRIVSTCSDSRQHLDVASKEGITRPWEGAKGDFLALVRCTIEKPKVAIEHPLSALKELLIVALEHFHERTQVDDIG